MSALEGIWNNGQAAAASFCLLPESAPEDTRRSRRQSLAGAWVGSSRKVHPVGAGGGSEKPAEPVEELRSWAPCPSAPAGLAFHAWVPAWHLPGAEPRQPSVPLWGQQPEGRIPQEQQGHSRSHGLWAQETPGGWAWLAHSHLRETMLTRGKMGTD